jgi:hypothetical protein
LHSKSETWATAESYSYAAAAKLAVSFSVSLSVPHLSNTPMKRESGEHVKWDYLFEDTRILSKTGSISSFNCE